MSITINGEKYTTFSDYMADEKHVSASEREQIEFETSLIEKIIEARKAKGFSQRDLAKASGVKQPAISRLESMITTPQIDTLFKLLGPLGYTIKIVPLIDKTENKIENKRF